MYDTTINHTYSCFYHTHSSSTLSKCQCPKFRGKEAKGIYGYEAPMSQIQGKEAQAKATKCQCPEFRERKVHVKEQYQIRRSCPPCTVLQAYITPGPDHICICCNWLPYRKTVIGFKLTKCRKAPEDFIVWRARPF